MTHNSSASSVIVTRRMCDLAWFQKEFVDERARSSDVLHVLSTECEGIGLASRHECEQLVSSSFRPLITSVLPLPSRGICGSGTAELGGYWFWETYRHALLGENVLIYLGGTGVSLTEDTLDSQVKLRGRMYTQDSTTSPLPLSHTSLLQHGSAKLEVVYALALSVALHVAKQPLLERGEGPQAVVLCATKDQCDELTYALNQFCPLLHLIVHNLFEPYPPMPADKRAEVVVATPPLWESLSKCNPSPGSLSSNLSTQRAGLEDLLVNIEGKGQLPPMYDLTRWRPYSLAHVAQLLVFDVGLQINMGFAAILKHLMRTERDSPQFSRGKVTVSIDKLPRSSQLYVVHGEDRFVTETACVDAIIQGVRDSGRLRGNVGTAEVSLALPSHTLPGATGLSGAVPHSDRKRPRAEVQPMKDLEQKSCHDQLKSSLFRNRVRFDGVLIRNALSHTRLHLDFGAFTDFVTRVVEEASGFWDSFDSGIPDGTGSYDGSSPSSSPTAVDDHVKATTLSPSSTFSASVLRHNRMELALVCAAVSREGELDRACGVDGVAKPTAFCAQELCVWVHPVPSTTTSYMSRQTLLFQHLYDRLNGELFDGSIVQCVLAADAPLLPFELYPVPPPQDGVAGNRLYSCDAFHYGPHMVQPALLEIVRKVSDAAAAASAARGAMRREAFSSIITAAPSTVLLTAACVPRFFFLPVLATTDQRQSDLLWTAAVPSDVCTVVVLRNVAASHAVLCAKGPDTDAEALLLKDDKPLALYLIEECCQYGRVLSYYVHEADVHISAEALGEKVTDGEIRHIAVTDDVASTGPSTLLPAVTRTASLFIEFADPDAAVEAVRLISRRLSTPQLSCENTRSVLPAPLPRARLFKNRTYYEGVLQEEASPTGNDDVDTLGDEDESVFGDILKVSLLEE